MADTSYSIHVIDDDDFVRDALRALLKSAGFKVEVFESAEAFLNSGHHRKNGLLVLDVRLPGMNGLELQRYLLDSGITMPIVFVTAHDNKQVREKAMVAGAVAFLQKPVEDYTLIDSINRVLSV